eukprot:m.310364 g.310364  ORF g.310364 m.310364 type:complete len:283 (+) comp51109_c0_seq1:65-913(+)
MTDPRADPLFIKAISFFRSIQSGSDKCLYDLLAEYTKKPCKWLIPKDGKSGQSTSVIREFSEVIDESTSSSSSSKRANISDEEEVVELVSEILPSSSTRMSQSDDDDDEISKFMSEHGVLIVTEEEPDTKMADSSDQIEMEEESSASSKKRVKVSENAHFSNEEDEDDSETDSCSDYEGFEANVKQGLGPGDNKRMPSQSKTVPPPPPLKKIPFSRRISVDKASGRALSPGIFQESSSSYSMISSSSRGMSPGMEAARAKRLSQMRKQAVKLSQNSKAPVKK